MPDDLTPQDGIDKLLELAESVDDVVLKIAPSPATLDVRRNLKAARASLSKARAAADRIRSYQ